MTSSAARSLNYARSWTTGIKHCYADFQDIREYREAVAIAHEHARRNLPRHARAFKSPTKSASFTRWPSTAPTAFSSATSPAFASIASTTFRRSPIFRSTPPTS